MLSYTLRRYEKIKKSSEFLTIYKRGVTKESQHFKVAILPNNLQWSRFGVTAGKKIGKAVQRNYVKRRLREYFRLHKALLPQTCDIVFTAKQGAYTLSYRDIARELNEVLIRNR